jgi:hypothetical protein
MGSIVARGDLTGASRLLLVIPAQAGIQVSAVRAAGRWIPAFAFAGVA